MSLQDYKKGEEIVECECGCCKVVVDLFDWTDKKDEVGISFVSSYLGNKRSKFIIDIYKNNKYKCIISSK